MGIVALIIGTPLTALMAHEHGEVPFDVKVPHMPFLVTYKLSCFHYPP